MIKQLTTNEELQQVLEIFFESSAKKNFKSIKERADFQFKYLGYYLENYPELFLIFKDEDQVLGYICGCKNSADEDELMGIVPHYRTFLNEYDDFPSELHINMHTSARGKGIGSKLIREFEQLLIAGGVNGVHLITVPTARNVGFYRKNGYVFEHIRDYCGTDLLLMGKSLK